MEENNQQEILFKSYYQDNHVMIDLETLGKKDNAVIVQLSAVRFNPMTGQTFEDFDEKISIQSALDLGLSVDESTMKFWLTQDRSAIDKVFFDEKISPKNIVDVLERFSIFLQRAQSKYWSPEDQNREVESWAKAEFIHLWGNGPTFDLSKLATAYQYARNTPDSKPWLFYNEKCVRTIVSIYPMIKKEMPFDGEKHYGLHDCKHQIKYVSATLNYIVDRLNAAPIIHQ